MKHSFILTVLALGASLFVAETSQATFRPQKSKPSSAPPTVPADPEPSTKTVGYGEKDVVKLKTKVRFTTLIVLPENERILDFSCGDKEFWIVNGNQNFAYVKPAKEGSTTNLNLITASGNIYTFVLVEVSNLPNAEPDLKVFIEPKEQSMISAVSQPPRFVPAEELDSYRRQVEIAKEETKRVEEIAQKERDAQIGIFLSETKFTYQFDPKKKPFHVSAIYHDKKFTYIKADPEETPTLYEIRDGKPNLVNFEYKDGVYIADKLIDRGYLAIGKSRLLFVRRESQ
jgi:type IV secretion system protein VirB9